MTSRAAGTITFARQGAAPRCGSLTVRACLDDEREQALEILRRWGHADPGDPTHLVVATSDDLVIAAAAAYSSDPRNADIGIKREWVGAGLGQMLGRALGIEMCTTAEEAGGLLPG